MNNILTIIARLFLGKGIDRKFPFLVVLYKKIFSLTQGTSEIQVPIPLASQLIVSQKDSGLGMYLRTKGSYEAELTKSFLKTVKKGHIVFDIGANIGYYTVLASKLVGKTGTVYAFEPDPRNIALLRKNLSLNKCFNVEIVESCLGNKNGTVSLSLDQANPGESRVSAQGTYKVPSTTLDSFVKKHKVKTVDVIKIDIEGREPFVFEGATSTFKQNKTVQLFLEYNQSALKEIGSSADSLTSQLHKLGFSLKHILVDSQNKSYTYSTDMFKTILTQINYVNVLAYK